MTRETIGHVKCPICGDMAEVRRDKRGKLYYLGAAGMIKPNLPSGQAWLESAMIPMENHRQDITDDEDDNAIGRLASAFWG